jgi:hypothetical protein
MLKKMRVSELPKRSRKAESNFESLPEWPKLKAALDAGLGVGEAWDFTVSPEQAKEYGLEHRRTGMRFVKKYVRSLGQKYTVKSITRADGNHYQIANEAVVTKRKRTA